MINLHAILALPKGTDHYISDIHGAYEQVRPHPAASGAIRRKINQTFGGELSDQRQVDLAMLIYYPEQKLHQVLAALDDPREWMAATIGQLRAWRGRRRRSIRAARCASGSRPSWPIFSKNC